MDNPTSKSEIEVKPASPIDKELLANLPSTIKRLRWISYFMDESIGIPGTNWKFGLDPLVGLIPVVGDFLPVAINLYFVIEGKRLGISDSQILKMLGNILADFLLGSVPLAGDIFDAAWKANSKNMEIIEKYLEEQGIEI